ncbi:MAG: leucyl aminopeptidase [Desulforhopalus sp.]
MIVSKKKVEEYSGDLLVVLVARKSDGNLVCDDMCRSIFDTLGELEEFSGKAEQILQLYPNGKLAQAAVKCKRLLIVGLGELEEGSESGRLYEIMRTAGGLIAGQCKKNKVSTLAIKVPEFDNIKPSVVAEYVTEGLLLGSYQFLKYKTKEDNLYVGLKKITYFDSRGETKTRKAATRGSVSAMAACVARDMANEPGNGWTPAHFAEFAKRCAKTHDLKCTVLEKNHMKKYGMEGILGVNKGSKEAPKLVMLDYNPGKKVDTILLVGKGLTFDSGGISLKPAQGMMDMKYDMCGGAAVLGAMQAIATEKPNVRVVAMVPATDNMAGGGAIKPGDIITHYNGVTSEIENTDAEGRLILADALAYGIEKYDPVCVVDLATLTGAVILALGHHYSGLMSNHDLLAERLIAASKNSCEPLWRLPLGEMYRKQIKSKVADIKNTGGRPAGSITAAEYLHRFVGKVPWAHLDIAGTAWDFTEKSYIPKGPSGFGVRTLIEFVRSWENGSLKGAE